MVSGSGRTRVLNTHYFKTPELPPIEIMSGGATGGAIAEFLMPKFCEIGLGPIVVYKESTCLIYNRTWAALTCEVMLVQAEQVGTPQDIDKLFCYTFRFRGAPCEQMDKLDLQNVCNIEKHYIKKRGNIPRYPVNYILRNYVDKGHLGIANGQGLFDHHTNHEQIEKTSRKQSLRDQLIGAWEVSSTLPSPSPTAVQYCSGMFDFSFE